MEDKTIRFYSDVNESGMPFIKVREGDFKDVVFLLDTGSNYNVLFGHAYEHLKASLTKMDCQSDSFGIEGNVTSLPNVGGKLSICGKEYTTIFDVREDNTAIFILSKQVGFTISGIIGTQFMAEHDWTIDFKRQEIVIPATDVTTSDLKTLYNKKKHNG